MVLIAMKACNHYFSTFALNLLALSYCLLLKQQNENSDTNFFS